MRVNPQFERLNKRLAMSRLQLKPQAFRKVLKELIGRRPLTEKNLLDPLAFRRSLTESQQLVEGVKQLMVIEKQDPSSVIEDWTQWTVEDTVRHVYRSLGYRAPASMHE